MEADSLTYKYKTNVPYIPRVDQREKNLFIEEYYSSTDVRIYIDDEEQTEIGYINYSLQEQLKPIYGYSSRTFDDVAVGNRIVTGTLKIPIKNPEENSDVSEMNQVVQENYSVEAYNRQQQEEENSNDLVNTYNNPIYNSNTMDSDNESTATLSLLQQAIEILNQLNLPINTTGNIEQDYENIINALKQAFGFEPNSTLTDDVQSLIDEILAMKEYKKNTIMLDAGQKLYLYPDINTDFEELEAQTKAIRMSLFITGWTMVQLPDGAIRYISDSDE